MASPYDYGNSFATAQPALAQPAPAQPQPPVVRAAPFRGPEADVPEEVIRVTAKQFATPGTQNGLSERVVSECVIQIPLCM
jgi:hypothetical protein